MKITAKTTKDQLKSILGANAKAVKTKDKELFDRIAYADKMAKKDDSKVSRKDLVDLVKEVMKVLGDALVEPSLTPVVENSVKKIGKGVAKKQQSMEDKTPAEPVENTEEAPAEPPKKEENVEPKKKSAKKSLGKKKETPKKDDDTASKGTVQEEKVIFPEVLKLSDEDTEYKLAHDIKSMDDLYKALENDERIVFAFHWTRVDLKKYPYFDGMLKTPKSFEHDLDLATTLYVSEERKIAYHISTYTEGCYNTLPDDFEEIDNIRYAGMMFNIYRAV